MNLKLDKTELVVLSACETGLGEIKNGEGVYGLQRALKIAGANTIIISLWTVNDKATQLLMTTFYDNWMKTGNKREAFKSAQNVLRQEFPAHYYWGPFIMVGE
jgi:CHAT domain-containing protein